MKKKDFDAVEMKRQCQERVRKKNEGLSDAQIRENTAKWLATGEDSLARLWRRAEAHAAGERFRRAG